MQLRQLTIEHFRGIKRLDWKVDGSLICLVGPGDSTKTTILDAIELALSPRWNVAFDDSDFYGASTTSHVAITVTVGDLPKELESDAKFGLLTRGWSSANDLHDEPQEGDDLVLTIQLRVGASLEPSWAVINDRSPDGKPINAKDREALGCVRLGDFLDRHFAWGRGSALSRLTETDDDVGSMLADAGRAARAKLSNLGEGDLPSLRAAAAKVQTLGKKGGVAPRQDYRPNLDVKAVSVSEGGLSLHEGDVPVRRAGLGTRRLLAIAMQRETVTSQCLSLIDEIEHGLEPHRIRNVLWQFRQGVKANEGGSVMMTTHAPVVLEELEAIHLRVVRSVGGQTTVTAVPTNLQPIVRKASEAFLARKVLICEGRTEVGFCRALNEYWSGTGPSFALAGIALTNGGGSEAPGIVLALTQLGYDTALLGDSDTKLVPDEATLIAAGALVILWAGGVSIEQRLALDLPLAGVLAMLDQAAEYKTDQSVRDAVASRVPASVSIPEGPRSDWPWPGSDVDLRKAVGLAAKKCEWFKQVGPAQRLAGIVIEHLVEIAGTDLGQKVTALRTWAHGN